MTGDPRSAEPVEAATATDLATAEDARDPAGAPDEPATPTGRGMALVALLVGLRVLALIVVLATGPDQEGSIVGGDARRYQQIADAEGIPYRDVTIEYPPGSVVVIEAVDADTLYTSQVRLALSQLACDLGTAAVLAWGFRRRVGIAYLVLGLPLLAFPFLYLRVDLVSVLLAAAALAVVHRRRDRWGDAGGGVLLALGVLTKLWPFALIPVLVVERRWRALGWGAAAGAVLGGAWVAVAGPDGAMAVVSFRDAAGWQLESVTGIVVHVLEPARAHVESGAWRTGIMPTGARPLLTLLSLITVGSAWWGAWRWPDPGTSTHDGDDRPAGPSTTTIRYGVAPTAAVLGLLVFAPIISPQYVLWLLPSAAVAAVGGERLLGWLVLAAAALSTLSLALIRYQIDGDLVGTLPVLARNLVLVAALARALGILWAGGRSRTRRRPAAVTP